jgi:hypothetical protein
MSLQGEDGSGQTATMRSDGEVVKLFDCEANGWRERGRRNALLH